MAESGASSGKPPQRPIRLTREGPAARVVFACRTFTSQVAQQLAEACAEVARDDSVRVLALESSEREGWPGTPLGPSANDRAASIRMADALAVLEVPTVVALRGRAWDLALELALACDLRLASSDASFALRHLAHGAVPWDGGTQRLPRLIGPARASEMLLLGREVNAGEALDWGLVQAVVPPERLSESLAAVVATVARAAPVAARYAREAARRGLDLPLEAGLRLEADLSFLLHATEDRAEGLRAFLEKREPEYRGR